MTVSRTVQFEVSEEVAEFLHRKVETGDFADEAAVVRHALEDAVQADAEFERWIRDQVIPTIARIEREGSSGLSIDEAWAELARRRLARQADV